MGAGDRDTPAPDRLPGAFRSAVSQTLRFTEEAAVSPAAAVRWLAVAASGSEWGIEGRVFEMMTGPVGRPEVAELEHWVAEVPEQAVPLAWAAGLTPEEAGRLWRSGDLNEAGLRSLAALQGLRLPQAPLFPTAG